LAYTLVGCRSTSVRIIQSSEEDDAFEVFAEKKLVLEKQMVPGHMPRQKNGGNNFS
jgi:hypothetical protein